MSNAKLLGACMTKAALALGLAGASVALYAESSHETVRVLVDDQEIAVACSQSASRRIPKKLKRCLEIFDGEGERMIAELYCKPLAVAQACTPNSVTTTN